MNLLSWSISRVLSWTVIPLGDKLLCRSSNLPELWTGHAIEFLFGLAYEWSLPCCTLLPTARCALTTPFHPYRFHGGLLSVALVVGSRRPDVIRHSALCSSDFPSRLLVPLGRANTVKGFNKPAIV